MNLPYIADGSFFKCGANHASSSAKEVKKYTIN